MTLKDGLAVVKHFFTGSNLIRVERNRLGQFSYSFFDGSDFVNSTEYLRLSLENPVLMTIIAFRSSLYSKMRITHVDQNGKEVQNSPYLKLLSTPNYFQSQEDFLFQQMWFLSANGTNNIYQNKPFSKSAPLGIYNLIPSQINYNNTHKINKFLWKKEDQKAFSEREIEYTLDNTTYKIKIGDLIPLYDLANGLTNNSFIQSPSRVKGITRPLENIEQNLKSKHKNLQMSAKYFVKNNSDGNEGVIQDGDRTAIERVLGRKDIIITNQAKIDAGHLLSDMKRLYLDEQYAEDFLKCLLAFDMNKNVINPFSKDSTFENQSQGLISYVQNSIQTTADNTMNSLSQQWGLFEVGHKLIASFDHLPIMQSVINDKVNSFKALQETIKIGLENKTLTEQEAKQMSDNFKLKLKL